MRCQSCQRRRQRQPLCRRRRRRRCLRPQLAAGQASLTENKPITGVPRFSRLSLTLSLAADRKYTFVFAYRFLYTHTSKQSERERNQQGGRLKLDLAAAAAPQLSENKKHKIILNRNYRICSKNVTKMQITTKKKEKQEK